MSVPTVALKDKGGNVELKVEDNKEFQVALEGNAIRECGTGYYKYCGTFTLAPTAEGNVSVTAYKDGVAIPGATASATALGAGDFVNVSLSFVTREFCGCCEDVSNISFVLGESASNVTNVAVVGEKL